MAQTIMDIISNLIWTVYGLVGTYVGVQNFHGGEIATGVILMLVGVALMILTLYRITQTITFLYKRKRLCARNIE